MGIFGGGGDQVTTTERKLDTSTQGFLDEFRKRGLQRLDASGTLPTGLESFRAGSEGLLGNLDFANQRGLTGIGDFFNPEVENVIGNLRPEFQRQRELSSNQAGAAATGANAFGGTRQGVLESIGLSDINRNEGNTIGGIRQQAFGNAANRLFSERQRAGQLGQAGLQNLFGLGQFMNQRQQQAFNSLTPGFQAGGSTITETTPQQGGGLFGGLLGVAGTVGGALLGGPAGAAAGNRLGSSFGSRSSFNRPTFGSGFREMRR